MSDLTTTRDHALMMAAAVHKPECRAWVNRPSRWGWQEGRWVSPDPDCRGCVSDADRALWRQIASEITEHLDRHAAEDLFGEMTAEPTTTAHTTEPEEAS